MVMKLRELIRAIRATKTAAEERAVVAKESAYIRTAIKEEQADSRYVNVSKLLYIHLLGYPAHFGQIECLKLAASSSFSDKRLGYLGIMMLLDENQEVLTLVINSLKNDLNNSNMYICGLALCVMANIASVEMARDLCPDIESLLSSSNAFLRKKAILCAVKIIRKVPELIENFSSKCLSLLNERSHGTLITGITLINEILNQDPKYIHEFRKCVPVIIKHLKGLMIAGHHSEYEVHGVTDPFLQIKILKLLAKFGKDSETDSDLMNQVLAQIVTNCDQSKNVGNSILYEAVLTILHIQSEDGLKSMAISVLGKFLVNRDNNIRYVALNTLQKCLFDTETILKHQRTILDCLNDPDVSIRRRALELCFALINKENVQVMVNEILLFLQSENEFQLSIVTNISNAIEEFFPNEKWYVDNMLRILKNLHCTDQVVSNFVNFVQSHESIKSYATHRLFHALSVDFSESLMQAASWCIGEFGECLLVNSVYEDCSLKMQDQYQIVDTLNEKFDQCSLTSKGFILNAIAKLSLKFSCPRIEVIIEERKSDFNTEIQQRAFEFGGMAEELRKIVLAPMPLFESETKSDLLSDLLKPTGLTVFDKDNILITLERRNDQIEVSFHNSGPDVSEFVFQVAVPKSQTIEMFPASSSYIPSGSLASQKMIISGSTSTPLKLRIKVSYSVNGEQREYIETFVE